MTINNNSYFKHWLYLVIFFLLTAASSCKKDETKPDQPSTFKPPGVFVVNEGNFTTGNASLTWYGFDNDSVVNDVFYSVNAVPLGDVANFMTIYKNKGYIVVNNSGLIYVVNIDDGKFVGKIGGLHSPREILIVNDSLAFISDLLDDYLTVINPATLEITGKVDLLGRSAESMIRIGSKLFAANWSGLNHVKKTNDVVLVVNIDELSVTDTIKVTKEPNSMVVDKEGKLWVLCGGGYDNQVLPALYQINPDDNTVVKQVVFPDKNCSPSELSVSQDGNRLYYINKDIYEMSIFDLQIPGQPWIERGERTFYSLKVNSVGDEIVVSDVLDYVRNGQVYIYDQSGNLKKQFEAGIIPGYFCFYQK